MAKQTYATVKPARSSGYGMILFLTLLAICGGIALICLEMNEYKWENQAKTSPLPKVDMKIPPEPDPNAPAPKDKD
jgi:hypothetical protein